MAVRGVRRQGLVAKADPSAGVMSEGIGAADESCSEKARVQRAAATGGPLSVEAKTLK
ncbi:hypothetical protein [Edaphovirga cremea]|nr:hypothetical protein [Edaphovirga cremea]